MNARLGQDHLRLLNVLVLAPVERVRDVPVCGWLIASGAGILTVLRSDLLVGILFLLLLSNGVDWFLGRACAKRADVYDPLLAQAGALTKIAALLMVLLIRGFEWWASANGIPGLARTHGALSAAVCAGLFTVDLESIEHHRIFLGARPIPGFSQVIAALRLVEQRLLPPLPTPPPKGE